MRVERVGLFDRAGEAVQYVAPRRRVGGRQPLIDESDHDVVADEATGVHDLLGHQAELGSLTGRGAQHVAGRDVRNDEVP